MMFASVVQASSLDYDIKGDIDYRWSGDTMIFDYEVQILDFRPDSLWLRADSAYALFFQDSNQIWVDPGCVIDTSGEGYYFTGSMAVPDFPKNLPHYTGFIAKGDDSVESVYSWRRKRLRPYPLKILFDIWGAGYAMGELTKEDTRHAAIFGIEFGFQVPLAHSDILVSTMYRGNLSDSYAVTLNEPLAIRYKYLPYGRTSMVPAVTVGFKNTRLGLARDPVEYRKSEWGLEAGISFEGAFERLSYSYSTGVDSYHTVSVMIASFSAGYGRTGTTFEYVHHDRMDMFRIQMHLEGAGWDIGESETLERINRRPFWHKALSKAAALPFLPLWGVFKLFGLND